MRGGLKASISFVRTLVLLLQATHHLVIFPHSFTAPPEWDLQWQQQPAGGDFGQSLRLTHSQYHHDCGGNFTCHSLSLCLRTTSVMITRRERNMNPNNPISISTSIRFWVLCSDRVGGIHKVPFDLRGSITDVSENIKSLALSLVRNCRAF